MAMSDIAIRIGADFLGLPAFKKADTAVDKLYKSTTKLAAAFGVTFSAAAVGRFAASSIRAFAAEERQIATLTTTVKNLGLAFQADSLNAYVEDLERLTGVTRDQLNPALQKLLTQTGSVTKSQQILSAALEVSFSGLVSLEEAANALSQAYVGNTKGIKQLNLGLTNTELKMMSFDQILAKVNQTYNSQFKSAMENAQTKINKVKVAADNAKESIGGGLVKAFSDLAGNGNLDAANSKLEKMGELLGRIIGNAFNPVQVGGFYLPIPNLLAKDKQKNTIGSPAEWRKRNAAILKAEKDAADKLKKIEDAKLKTLREQLANKKAQAALDKATIQLNAAKNVFDLERIGIAAAMENSTLTENEKKRLEIKQAIFALEDAIDSKDTARITKQTDILNGLLGQFNTMQKQDILLGQIKSNLETLGVNKDLINLLNLQEALKLLKEMNLVLNGTKQGSTSNNIYSPTLSADLYKATANTTFASVGAKPFSQPMTLAAAGIPATADISNLTFADVGAIPFTTPMSISGQNPTVIVQITDNAQKLVDAVTFATQNNSANGTPVALSRNATNLAW